MNSIREHGLDARLVRAHATCTAKYGGLDLGRREFVRRATLRLSRSISNSPDTPASAPAEAHLPDLCLAMALENGNLRAYTVFRETITRPIRSALLTRHAHLGAEAVVHEVTDDLLGALLGLPSPPRIRQYLARSSLFTWTYQIAARRVGNGLRSRERRQATLLALREITRSSLRVNDAEGPVVSDELEASVRVKIRSAIRAMRPRERTVFLLRYGHRLSRAETADVLRTSRRTVSKHSSRAKRRIRRSVNTLRRSASLTDRNLASLVASEVHRETLLRNPTRSAPD